MAGPLAGDVSCLLPPSLSRDKPFMEVVPSSESALSRLGFPSEFPYEFDSSAFTSPGESTETEEESSDDEEDFLAGLTRRLALSTQRLPVPDCINRKTEEKNRVIVSSPQSTLSGLGSWSASDGGSPNGPSSQVPSPPTTPIQQDDAWEVISAAAGQVARLKMNSFEQPNHLPSSIPAFLLRHACAQDLILSAREGKLQNAAFLSAKGFQPYRSAQSNQFPRQDEAAKQKCCGTRGQQVKTPCYQSPTTFKSPEQMPMRTCAIICGENGRYVRPVVPSQMPWMPSSAPQQPSVAKSVFPGGSIPKRRSAGTGVFLPRRYTPPDSRKKLGSSSVVLPSKNVHPQTHGFDDFSGRSQPCLPAGVSLYDYESLMARRNAILAQRRSQRQVNGGSLKAEIPLPQDWLY